MTNEELFAEFTNIKLNFNDMLVSKKDPFKDLQYSMPNFETFKYDPFLKLIKEKIELLPFDDKTIEQLDALIKHANYQRLKIEDKKTPKVAEDLAQMKFIEKFENDIEVIKKDIIKSSNDNNGVSDIGLTENEIALLILYLQDGKLISKNFSDVQISKAFSTLTGLSENQIRKKITGEKRLNRLLITDKKESYEKLEDRLNKTIEFLKKDMKSTIN
jgi:hypothetical protein